MPYSITGYRELKLRIYPGVLCYVALKDFRKIYHTDEKKIVGDVLMMKCGVIILSMLHKRER